MTFDYQEGLGCTSGGNSSSICNLMKGSVWCPLPMGRVVALLCDSNSIDGYGMHLFCLHKTPLSLRVTNLCPWISVFLVIHASICKQNSQALKDKDCVVIGCWLFVACVCAAEHISLLLQTPRWLSTGVKVTLGGCTTPLSQDPGQHCRCPMARVLLPISSPACLGVSAHSDARQGALPDPHTAQGCSGGMQPWIPGKCPCLWHWTKWGFFQTAFCFFFQTLKDNQGESKHSSFPLCLGYFFPPKEPFRSQRKSLPKSISFLCI